MLAKDEIDGHSSLPARFQEHGLVILQDSEPILDVSGGVI